MDQGLSARQSGADCLIPPASNIEYGTQVPPAICARGRTRQAGAERDDLHYRPNEWNHSVLRLQLSRLENAGKRKAGAIAPASNRGLLHHEYSGSPEAPKHPQDGVPPLQLPAWAFYLPREPTGLWLLRYTSNHALTGQVSFRD